MKRMNSVLIRQGLVTKRRRWYAGNGYSMMQVKRRNPGMPHSGSALSQKIGFCSDLLRFISRVISLLIGLLHLLRDLPGVF